MWPWADPFTSQSLSFLICKRGEWCKATSFRAAVSKRRGLCFERVCHREGAKYIQGAWASISLSPGCWGWSFTGGAKVGEYLLCARHLLRRQELWRPPPQVADEKTKAQRGGVICPPSHSRKWDGRARIQPSLTWRDGSWITFAASAEEVLSQEINRVKQEIRENLNNLRQQNELLLSSRSHWIRSTEPVTNGAAQNKKVFPWSSKGMLTACSTQTDSKTMGWCVFRGHPRHVLTVVQTEQALCPPDGGDLALQQRSSWAHRHACLVCPVFQNHLNWWPTFTTTEILCNTLESSWKKSLRDVATWALFLWGDSGLGWEWMLPVDGPLGFWFTTDPLLCLAPKGPTYPWRHLDLWPLPASFEPSQLLASEVIHEVWFVRGWRLLATKTGREVTGPRFTGANGMSRLSLLVMGVSHSPEYLKSPSLAYIITMLIITS